jgi:hypothetical protein
MALPLPGAEGPDIGASESQPWPESQATVCNLVPHPSHLRHEELERYGTLPHHTATPCGGGWSVDSTPFSDRGVL